MIDRAAAVSALRASHFDVIVVGAGITGAGVALDAASRGYSVAVVEKADFAAGTSSRSSKLVHGGLRYLQSLDLGLVREALLERQLLTSLAPHLVTPLPLVLPSFHGARPNRLTGVGLNLYDVMALRMRRASGRRGKGWSLDRHRTIDAAEVLELLPALAPRSPTSGHLFYDCQADDARLVLTVLGEAERFGAICANRLEVIGLVEEIGRVRGVTLADRETGERLAVAADHVVNATGVWADRLQAEDRRGEEGAAPVIRPSRGAHITLSNERVPLVGGAIAPAGAGRTIFALPWLGRTLIGTTDVDHRCSGGLDHVAPTPDDLAYLLDAASAFFAIELSVADVTGAFAGVRPLIATGDPRRSVDISRKAELYESSSGLVTITGGKLTTYRRMAKLVVDRIVERDGREARCRTDAIELGRPVEAAGLAAAGDLPERACEHLAARYGIAAHGVLDIVGERPELAQPIVDGLPDLLAEVAFAARHEQARSVGDVLLRRTRVGLLAAREVGRTGPLERVAVVLGRELGWSAHERSAQIERFRAEALAEGNAP